MSDLDDYNHTELVAIAAANDVPGFHKSGATKGVPRAHLIRMLEGLEALEIPEPLDDIRSEIEEFVRRRWSRLKDQMSLDQCPHCRGGHVRRGDFKRCSDLSVALCFNRNAKFMRK
jgi:hypothetical protein